MNVDISTEKTILLFQLRVIDSVYILLFIANIAITFMISTLTVFRRKGKMFYRPRILENNVTYANEY